MPPLPSRSQTSAMTSDASGVERLEQRVDLERARDAGLDPLLRLSALVIVGAVEQDVPPVGRSKPVTRLTKVVLPAPFGPMIACRSPRRRAKFDIARRRQARRTPCASPRVASTGRRRRRRRSSPAQALRQRLDRRHDPPAEERDHDDEQQPDPEIPVDRARCAENQSRAAINRSIAPTKPP